MVHDGPRRDYDLPPAVPSENEGKTVAGWVMFWVVCVGALVTALGLVLWEQWVLIAGLVILVGGLVVSAVLSAMGKGQPRNRENPPRSGEANWYS